MEKEILEKSLGYVQERRCYFVIIMTGHLFKGDKIDRPLSAESLSFRLLSQVGEVIAYSP